MQKVKYRKVTVKTETDRRTGVCVFGHTAKRKTDWHHARYAYTKKEVLANPELVWENGFECCYPHHIMANTVRKFTEMPLTALQTIMENLDAVSAQRLCDRMILALDFMDKNKIAKNRQVILG